MHFDKADLNQLANFSVIKNFKEKPDALALFGQILQKKTFEMRDYILKENSDTKEMFFLLSGKVSINKKSKQGEIILLAQLDAKIYPFFGEAAILGIPVRSANVTADTSCTCLSLNKEDFDLFTQEEPYLALMFYRNLAQAMFYRLQKADQDLFILGTYG